MKGRHQIALLTLCALLAAPALADQPAVTVYSQKFGVVREKITLELKAGVNQVQFTAITAHVEPDSVVLRDPTGQHHLQILEQNYRADPLSQELLLSLFEGQTIDFVVRDSQGADSGKLIRGKIIRSAYVPHRQAWNEYGGEYRLAQTLMSSPTGSGLGQPIIEVDGQIRFGLPGTPLFPSLGDDTILKPTLNWVLDTDATGKVEGELSYVTGGMNWKADYNLIAPGSADALELVGWVTIDNQTGRTFEDAQIKLMAGEVSKIEHAAEPRLVRDPTTGVMRPESSGPSGGVPTFDEYHLYTLQRPTTLRDREAKQVEFIRAANVQGKRVYAYDGASIGDGRYESMNPTRVRTESDFGTAFNRKVWAGYELENTAENHLGVPLPAGRMRFYRRDVDGRLEFTGENDIGHTPKDEMFRLYTGNAFDLVGERRRTAFEVDSTRHSMDESFEIKIRNHKSEPVAVCIIEHLYRWKNWEIRESSDPYTRQDAQTIEFRPTVPPDGEKVVTYSVHYAW